MNKINLIKNQIDEIISSKVVKAIFTTENINNTNDCTIDLYFLINEEQLKLVYNYISSIIISHNVLLFEKSYKYINYLKTSYYYENSININVFYLYDLNIKIYQNIISLYDPYDLLKSFEVSLLLYTNKEYAKKIDEFSVLLFEFYKSILNDDKVLSYNISLKIQNLYILIYRGFYDSMNAKKELCEIIKTMPKDNYHNLLNKIRILKYDTFFDAIREYVKDVDLIVSRLPINVISLLNIDFYNYTKKLIYAL